MQGTPGAAGATRGPRFGLMLGLLALLAFAVREHFVLATIVDVPIRGDIREYVAYAWNLVEYGVFGGAMPPNLPVPDDYRAPGYPWLIALGMRLWPQNPDWVELGAWYPFVVQVQVALGTATAVLVALLARHWLSATWSIAAGLLLALWPHHVAATNALLSEVVFGFLLVAALYAFARACATRKSGWWAAAGALFGYAYLVNPLVVFFPPCLAVLAWWHGFRKPAVLLLALFLMPVIGMGLRNATIDGGQDRGSGYRAALNFVQGSWPDYHPAAVRVRSGDPRAVAVINEINAETTELRKDTGVGLQRIAERMVVDPAGYARWYAGKPWLLWGWSIRLGAGGIYFHDVRNSPFERNLVLRAIATTYRAVNPLLTTITLACGLVLLATALRRPARLPAIATGSLAIYLTLVHVVLQAEPRYSTAYRGLEAVLVATALAWGWQWLRARGDRASNSSGAAATHAE